MRLAEKRKSGFQEVRSSKAFAALLCFESSLSLVKFQLSFPKASVVGFAKTNAIGLRCTL